MVSLGRCGPYELERFLEAGGMGEIFLARGPTPRGPGLCAVKRLLPQAKADAVFAQMFLDEGRLAQELRHPNVCQVYDLGEHDGLYYIAMEWVDGVSLEKLVKRAAGRAPIPQDLVARVGLEICSVLDYAHRLTDTHGRSLGIVHRDVSPPNIMLDVHGRVKLLDFGLAKARTQLSSTLPGYVKGKFGYLAPEQLGGDVDGRADVFALGLCLYELLTAKQLFDNRTAADTVRAIRAYRGVPSLVSARFDIWPELDAIVQRAVEPEREQRFESARAMKDALEAALRAHEVAPDRARMAEVVRSLFPDRRPVGPAPVSSAPPPPPPETRERRDAAAHLDALTASLERARKRRAVVVGIAVGAVVAATVAMGAWAAFG